MSIVLRFLVEGVWVKDFYTDLIVLPSIIGKEKYEVSVLYKYLLGMIISV